MVLNHWRSPEWWLMSTTFHIWTGRHYEYGLKILCTGWKIVVKFIVGGEWNRESHARDTEQDRSPLTPFWHSMGNIASKNAIGSVEILINVQNVEWKQNWSIPWIPIVWHFFFVPGNGFCFWLLWFEKVHQQMTRAKLHLATFVVYS